MILYSLVLKIFEIDTLGTSEKGAGVLCKIDFTFPSSAPDRLQLLIWMFWSETFQRLMVSYVLLGLVQQINLDQLPR